MPNFTGSLDSVFDSSREAALCAHRTLGRSDNTYHLTNWSHSEKTQSRPGVELPDFVHAEVAARISKLSSKCGRNIAVSKKRQPGEDRESARAVPDDAPTQKAPAQARDPRLPPPGSFIILKHGPKLIKVKVLEAGFIYDGKAYSTLSAVARAITGKHWNGFLFFGLGNKPKAST